MARMHACTSQDNAIQRMIREDESFKRATVLIIAHRIQTITHCDKIIVLEAGKVLEVGAPHALLKDPNSHYAQLVKASKNASGAGKE